MNWLKQLPVLYIILIWGITNSCSNRTISGNSSVEGSGTDSFNLNVIDKDYDNKKWDTVNCLINGILLIDTSVHVYNLAVDNYEKLVDNRIDTAGDCLGSYVYRNADMTEYLILSPIPGFAMTAIFEASIVSSFYKNYNVPGSIRLNAMSFTSGAGIAIGVDSSYIVNRFGNGFEYSKKDEGSSNLTRFYYEIRKPCDSKDKILERLNLPVYYMEFILKNNRLVKYSFGFPDS